MKDSSKQIYSKMIWHMVGCWRTSDRLSISSKWSGISVGCCRASDRFSTVQAHRSTRPFRTSSRKDAGNRPGWADVFRGKRACCYLTVCARVQALYRLWTIQSVNHVLKLKTKMIEVEKNKFDWRWKESNRPVDKKMHDYSKRCVLVWTVISVNLYP